MTNKKDSTKERKDSSIGVSVAVKKEFDSMLNYYDTQRIINVTSGVLMEEFFRLFRKEYLDYKKDSKFKGKHQTTLAEGIK